MKLREDNQNDKSDEIFDDPDDILAMLQDYSDNDFANVSQVDNSDIPLKDDTDDDLLALLDMISAKEETRAQDSESDEIFALDDNVDEWNIDEGLAATQDDNNDIISIDDMWSNEEFEQNDAKLKKLEIDELDELDLDNFDRNNLDINSYKSNNESSQDINHLSDIFSDVLSAVDTLEDKDMESFTATDNGKEISNKKEALSSKKEKSKEKKESFLKKLFSKDKLDANESKDKAKKKKDKVNKKQAKNKQVDTIDDEKKSTKKAKKVSTKDSKKKALSKNKIKEANNIMKEIGEDEDKPINKKAFAAVFLLLGSIFILFLLGTNLYTYSLGVKYATDYFEKGRYTDAYYEIYGVELKENDQILYDRIVTVMYVNKQLESYMNYYEMKEYPKALDSLFKGLKRYDQYIDHAIKLGVDEDLNTLRDAIVGELEDKFNITEKEATSMTSIEDVSEYSINVHTLVLEKMD